MIYKAKHWLDHSYNHSFTHSLTHSLTNSILFVPGGTQGINKSAPLLSDCSPFNDAVPCHAAFFTLLLYCSSVCSRNKSENYRPVSLTSVICKLLERLIKDHMVEFLVKHQLLNSSQHGFLKARSCLTNMLCFLEEITKWIDVGSPVDIIYLDFQKAFDKVPHQRLLLKLKAHGIGDSITDWIEQWLNDRRQRVVVDGEVSNWKTVLSGIPQGSVLGPILFLIYINDLDDSITSNVLNFADDTKLFRKVNTDGDKQHLQNDLDRLVKWSEKWQMLFNFGKCKCLHTGHRNLNVNYKMGDTVLGTTVKEKDLGVTISADMKVSEQCGIAASKGNQILGLIRRNITYKEKR